jgi:hypothetical protein
MRHTLSGLAKLQANLEKAALDKSNNLTRIAGPASEFLRNEQSVLSHFYLASKPLAHLRVLDMANVKSQDDLENRKMLLLQFLEANSQMSDYYRNEQTNFRAMAIKGGLPNATVEEDTKSLGAKLNSMSQVPEIWKVNDRLAKAKLRGLSLLASNWQNWSYDESLGKTIFEKESDKTEFNRIVAEINSVEREGTKLQQQLLTNFQRNTR